MSAPQPAPSPWVNVPGSLAQVTAANGDHAAGVNSAGGIYKYQPRNNSWTQIDNPGTVKQVALADNGDMYGVDQAGNIWAYRADGQGWGQIHDGAYQHVALAKDGTLFAATLVQVYNLGTGTPVAVGSAINGTITQFDVGQPDTVLIVNGGIVFKYNPTSFAWDTLPMDPGLSIVDVAVGYEGVMYAIDTANKIYRYVGQGGDPGRKNWLTIPGGLAQISCFDGADVWGVNRHDAIYKLRVDTTIPLTVNFGTNNKLSIAPDEVTVPFGKTYKLQWTVNATGHNNVSITAITFDNDPPFANLCGNFGPSVFVVDNDLNPGNNDNGFNYTLYLTADGQSFNTDPKIINQPSTGGD